jgi:hypothetical protein
MKKIGLAHKETRAPHMATPVPFAFSLNLPAFSQVLAVLDISLEMSKLTGAVKLMAGR